MLGIQPSMLWAQTTGKIAGTIKDASGESLPGVNVMINETLQGNASNADGDYFILNIKPGSYTLTVSYIGFKTIRITDVQVSVDRTTRLDFTMEEELLEGEEIVVIAQQSLVVKDQTSASAKVSGEELLNLPVQSFVETVSVA
ncbi:MAG: carboxypeptidase-like regulatory domain-containing protein [Bacteroidota bacterium]